jgi:hypothetical protein
MFCLFTFREFNATVSARSEMTIKGLGDEATSQSTNLVKENTGSTIKRISHTNPIPLLLHPLSRSWLEEEWKVKPGIHSQPIKWRWSR